MKAYSKIFSFLFVILISFVFGVIHIKWVYSITFHADAAAMQVLAQAIYESHSILPHDYYYGNQLIFLRSEIAIALAMAMGFKGYTAFIIGSALWISIWSTILFSSLYCVFKKNILAAFYTFCLFFPVSAGYDYDYILGQQSHLANVVLSLSILIFFILSVKEENLRRILPAALFIFLMVIEEPLRAAFVFITLIVTCFIFWDFKKYRTQLVILFVSFSLALILNKYLLNYYSLGRDISAGIKLVDYSTFLSNLSRILNDYLLNFSSLSFLEGSSFFKFSIIGYGFNFIYETIFSIYILVTLVSIIKNVIMQRPDSNSPFWGVLKVTAFIGLLFTTLAICLLNPDSSRHALWALFIIKLCFLMDLVRFFRNRFLIGKSISFLIVFAIVCLSSTWFCVATLSPSVINSSVYKKYNSDLSYSLKNLSKKYNVKNVYGNNYWSIMPFNVIIPEFSYGVLQINDTGHFSPMQWLSRPSYFDVSPDENVFYLVRPDEDKDGRFVDNIKRNNGILLDHVGGTDIWLAKPIWPIFNGEYGRYTWNGCQLPTQIGTLASNCTINKDAKDSEGYLSFGPYQKLPHGNYKFEIRIFSNSPGNEIIGNYDAILGNRVVLVSEQIEGTNGEFSTLSGNFTIKEGTEENTPVEIRVSILKNHNASIQAVKIEKVKNT
ncbi:hypothetical protein [Atlantibacter hermannii]|uniref:Glycosyltransferase RgtA/B/C/D-like domain-containing protein n=1 Tax=Atlantibacter hermannii NBRC 105704 TaxID=1115512 RepID=H5V0Q7_ATLHE|nr:hypothetical protein [Atlantibacter hermannii]QPS93094.1 hypothetical protein I6G45_06175 [Atlantibacter hermannii]GAB51565.1 hypothetical protein EH105704_03_00700 [Atlantibacter hermannii NBRC 105704]